MTLSSGHGAAEHDVREGSLIEAFADNPAKLSQVSGACERAKCEALVVLLDPSVQSFRTDVIAMAARLRIPAAYPTLEYAAEGGLITYSTEAGALYRRAAGYVDNILKGAKPADLPVERPTRFELVLNLKTATALGIKIPHPVLLRADRIIEQ